MKKLKILIFLTVSTTLVASAQIDGKTILQEYLNLVSSGDMNNFSEIKTAINVSNAAFDVVASLGELNFIPPPENIHKFYRKWPDFSRDDIYDDSVVTSTFITTRNKMTFRIGNMPVQNKELSSQFPRRFEFIPVIVNHLLQHAESIKYKGEKTVLGRNLSLVTCKYENQNWFLYFNPSTLLLEAYEKTDNDSTEPEILTELSNYQQIDKIQIPFLKIKYRNQQAFFYNEITDIKLNVEIDPSLFDTDELD